MSETYVINTFNLIQAMEHVPCFYLNIWPKLQSFTQYLRNSTIREKFNFCFQEFFASINKIFILAGGLGTRLSFYEA